MTRDTSQPWIAAAVVVGTDVPRAAIGEHPTRDDRARCDLVAGRAPVVDLQSLADHSRLCHRVDVLGPVEIDPDGMCCGAAGLYMVYEPATAAELGRSKAQQIEQAGPRIVASANPGCEIQLRAHLGKGYRIAHPIELYWEALNAID